MDDFLLYLVGVPVTFLLLILGMALAARRILGMRVGLIRTTVATLLAMSFTGSLFASLADTEGASTAYATVLFGVTLLFLIGMLALAEVIVPTGSIPPPVDWFRAVRGRIARTRRYSRITAIARLPPALPPISVGSANRKCPARSARRRASPRSASHS